MKGKTYVKKLTLNQEITLLKEQNIKNNKIVQDFKNLIQECKKDISIIEENKLFDEDLKNQTLSVLSNITLKMEMLMDIK